jgi:hypothetical protein
MKCGEEYDISVSNFDYYVEYPPSKGKRTSLNAGKSRATAEIILADIKAKINDARRI